MDRFCERAGALPPLCCTAEATWQFYAYSFKLQIEIADCRLGLARALQFGLNCNVHIQMPAFTASDGLFQFPAGWQSFSHI